MVRLALLVACACGPHLAVPAGASANDDVTLYRDWAVIKQRIDLDLPAGRSTAKLVVANGVASDQIAIVDRGVLEIGVLHGASGAEADTAPPATTTELGLDVSAPHAGMFPIVIAYMTERLRWDAAYTMTTTPARDRATVRGAIAIRNATGVTLKGASVHVIDAELPVWRGKLAEQLASSLVGATAGATPTPITVPRELGRIDIGPGETRVELIGAEPPRPMRSVLVYDPIGTKLDNPGASPLRDYSLGAHTDVTTVVESFAIDRDEHATAGLPAGPVRLLERHDDGSVVVLGESRLFEPSTRVAEVDTVPVGVADGVTGTRARREISLYDDSRRLVEEIAITLDNKRSQPARVLVREHLYRGQNWTLAYTSAYAEKEGPQQISLRTEVPAKSQQKLLYVVVYTWPQP